MMPHSGDRLEVLQGEGWDVVHRSNYWNFAACKDSSFTHRHALRDPAPFATLLMLSFRPVSCARLSAEEFGALFAGLVGSKGMGWIGLGCKRVDRGSTP
jgi:hypothetical protein